MANLPGGGNNLQDHPCVPTYYTTKHSFSDFGNTPEGIAYIKTLQDLPGPDIQLAFVHFFLPVTVPAVPGKGYTVNITLASPQSQGHLKLRSTDPTQYPVIFANYLANQEDLRKLVRGITLVRRLNQTKAFAPFYEGDAHPGPQIRSDKEMVEFVRNHVQSMYHCVGTCKMGHDDLAVEG